MLYIWADTEFPTQPPSQRHRHFPGNTSITVHRSKWHPEATYLGFKGGTPSANHGHMDIGSFVMAANGVRWAIDLGSDNYHKLESAGVDLWSSEQQSERWEVLRLSNRSHNTLVVNGQRQRVAGQGHIIEFAAEGDRSHAVMDLSSVYRGQLKKVQRGVRLRADESVLIRDELKALSDRESRVRWAMATRAEVRIKSRHHAILRQSGQTLHLHVQTPAETRLQTYSLTPETDYEHQNPGRRMVGFEVELAPRERTYWRVRLQPGGTAARPAETNRTELPQKSLDQW
jgi:hypothetical protein